MEKQQNIQFALVKIQTVEYATFEENFDPKKKATSKFNLGFDLNNDDQLIYWDFEVESFCEDKIFLKAKFLFTYKITEDSFSSLLKDDTIVFPKNILAHFAMLSIGTIRGILFEKISKVSSSLAGYILPLVNLSEIINEDVTIKIENGQSSSMP